MNKNKFEKLSKHDKMLLKRIEAGFEQARELLGNDPLIYHDFGITPDTDGINSGSLMNRRKQLFDEINKTQSKKV